MRGGRLIIVSNRLPVTVTTQDGVAAVKRSVGGLASGLRGPHERAGSVWIGWPGDLDTLEPMVRDDVARQLSTMRIVPVTLSREEVRVYYDRLCNAVLWPICHDRLDQLPLRISAWDAYETVNARFAEVVAEEYRPGDRIWIHDYHLMRLPALLRARLQRTRIGFFLHVPFPNPEIFFALPTRRWLVEGMLGADVIGFHTRRWRGRFTAEQSSVTSPSVPLHIELFDRRALMILRPRLRYILKEGMLRRGTIIASHVGGKSNPISTTEGVRHRQ